MNAPTNEPMRKYYYVAQRQMFEEIGEGRVRVTDEDGKSGVFHHDGRFIEGELTTVNTHMLTYVGGPRVAKAFNYRWTEIAVDVDRPSGWPEHLERLLNERREQS